MSKASFFLNAEVAASRTMVKTSRCLSLGSRPGHVMSEDRARLSHLAQMSRARSRPTIGAEVAATYSCGSPLLAFTLTFGGSHGDEAFAAEGFHDPLLNFVLWVPPLRRGGRFSNAPA